MKKPTKAEIASHLGISRKTLYLWAKQGCPIHRGIDAIQQWRAGSTLQPNRKTDTDPETAELKRELIKAQTEHYQTRTRLAELEHKLKTGQLVSLEEVETLLRKWYGPISEFLKTQPERLAHQVNPVDPEHARQVLDAERTQIFKLAKEIITGGGK